MANNYIPQTIDGYPKFAQNLIDHVKANQATWTHITSGDVKALDLTFQAYNGRIKYVIKDHHPESHEEFTHSTLATRTPHTLEFPNEFSGKRVWVIMFWQNARGILGRWTEMQTAIIP